jgi:ABC-type branched-subunit amino acid transport system permease subunit
VADETHRRIAARQDPAGDPRERAARRGVGYNVPRFKLLAFVIGGAFSGLAGVLYAMLFGIVPLEAISFVFSGNVVFATLIGGSGSLYGPIIGSFVFIWLSESMSTCGRAGRCCSAWRS